jgi:BirA family transcriptional regulator, biotin operon repressor / biotin---[acetyl-CoA-carboxylase] ligase
VRLAPEQSEQLLAELATAFPGELLAQLTLIAVDETDSTQRLARGLLERQLAEDETPPPTLVVALGQLAGRGRRGRCWESAPGTGLWATCFCALPAARVASVPMRAACALAEALEEVAPGARLKWPNDLVYGDKKVGGILVEVLSREGGKSWALVGFGINRTHAADELPTSEATSLALVLGGARRPPWGALAASCAARLLDALAEEGEAFLERYRALSAHRVGDPIQCELEGDRVAGTFSGFDERGFLRLATPVGERVISSGEVFAW